MFLYVIFLVFLQFLNAFVALHPWPLRLPPSSFAPGRRASAGPSSAGDRPRPGPGHRGKRGGQGGASEHSDQFPGCELLVIFGAILGLSFLGCFFLDIFSRLLEQIQGFDEDRREGCGCGGCSGKRREIFFPLGFS